MNALFRPLRNISGALLAFLLPLAAWAQSSGNPNSVTLSVIREAAQRDGDKSREALTSIFGEVVSNPLAIIGSSGDTILASVFMVTNGAILVIGFMFACYIFFQRLSNTAHDGAVFDRDKVTLWEPIRIVWGIATLVPTANGWSLAQLLMLWAASIIGIGVANLGVDVAMKAFDDGKSMVVQPVMPSTKTLAREIFIANLCMHGINKGLELTKDAGGLTFEKSRVQYVPGDWGFVLENKSGFVCGGAELSKWEYFNSTKGNISSSSTNNHGGILGRVFLDMQDIGEAHLQATRNMQTFLTVQAKSFVEAAISRKQDPSITLISAKQAIDKAAFNYEATVNKTARKFTGNIEALAKEISNSISDGGWWMLGAWYQTFAQANSKLLDVVSAKAQSKGMSGTGDSGTVDYLKDIFQAYYAQVQDELSKGNTSITNQGDGNNSAEKSDAERGGTSDASKIIATIAGGPLTKFTSGLFLQDDQEKQINPLIEAKNRGDYLMVGAETGLGIYAVIKSVADSAAEATEKGSIVDKVASFFPGGKAAIEFIRSGASIVDTLAPIVMLILVALFFFGAMLSIYLPFLPFVMWFGGIVNWMVVVGEAVIAAPLWALIHLGGEGDGFGHKTSHGYIFLLNCMVRPILMVIGFFLAGAALIVGGRFLNEVFGIALSNVQFDSITGVFSIIGFIAIYCGIFIGMVHTCFNLIFIVPDQVINWVGGTAAPHLGQDYGDRAHSMYAGAMAHVRSARPGSPRPRSSPGANLNQPGVAAGKLTNKGGLKSLLPRS